jgi:hypothetical protein
MVEPVEGLRLDIADRSLTSDEVPNKEFENKVQDLRGSDPPELLSDVLREHVMPKFGSDELREMKLVHRSWNDAAKFVIKQRRADIKSPLEGITNVITAKDRRWTPAAGAVLGAINEDLDDLELLSERGELASLIISQPNAGDFSDALYALGPGVRHIDVAEQNAIVDRAEEFWKQSETPWTDPNANGPQAAIMRLLPYLFAPPRKRAFDTFFVHAPGPARKAAFNIIAGQSHLMSETELHDAVRIATNPNDRFYEGQALSQASDIAALGRGRALSDQHRDPLLATAEAFADDEHASMAIAGVLDGASSTAHWPGQQRLEGLAARADMMSVPDNKARLMAAIASAAGDRAPQRAVDALKELAKDPQNGADFKALTNGLNSVEMSPMENMSPEDRRFMITHILDYDGPVPPEVATARFAVLRKALRQADPLSLEAIDQRLYDWAFSVPEVDDLRPPLGGAAQGIARRISRAEPAERPALKQLASRLIDRSLELSSATLTEELRKLRAVLPHISDQKQRALVNHVQAWLGNDPDRMRALGFLLQSRTALDPKLVEELVEATGTILPKKNKQEPNPQEARMMLRSGLRARASIESARLQQ